MKNKLGDRLNFVRLVQGDRKINELADKIGISRQSLSKIESGATRPHLDTLQLLADELDVSVDYLLGKSDNMNPHAEIGDLHMTDTTIYALRSNISYGIILSLSAYGYCGEYGRKN